MWVFLMAGALTLTDGFLHVERQLMPKGSSFLRALEIVCPDKTYPYQPSLSPIRVDLPPLIMHVKATVSYPSLSSFLSTETQLPTHFLAELAGFGSIYLDRGNGIKRVLSITTDDHSPIEPGCYARVHVNPRRYPDFAKFSSGLQMIKTEHDDVVAVLDKPAGAIPTVPTVDNVVENVMTAASSSPTGKTGGQQLYATGRLDACTSGALIFAKYAAVAKRINEQIVARDMRKVYRALCLADGPSVDIHMAVLQQRVVTVRHLFRRKSKAHSNAKPTLLRKFDAGLLPERAKGVDLTWQLAELKIIGARKVELDGLSLVDVEIELVTGRTHQIRLQMAALGSPIFGDTRYIPVRGLLDDDDDGSDEAAPFGPEPKTRIGLHCQSLTLPRHTFTGISRKDQPEELQLTASPPWWEALVSEV